MMLNIEEIKAQYAVALKSIEDSADDDVADFGIYPALHTIPALIAEVERLSGMYGDAEETNEKLICRAEKAESENATLKKALELAPVIHAHWIEMGRNLSGYLQDAGRVGLSGKGYDRVGLPALQKGDCDY